MNRFINVRVPDKLIRQAKGITEEFGFSSVQEFFRYSLRLAIEEYEKKKAIKRLQALKGSVKNIKRMTKKEKERWFKDVYLKTDPSETFRKFNL